MDIPLRATVIFFVLWALTRATGKRELAQLSAFELLLLVTFGDLVQQGVTQEDYSVTGATLAVGTIAFWVLVFSYTSFKHPRARHIIDGRPVIVVRDGEPLLELMHLERLTVDELKESAREHGIANLRDVRIGVLEPDGKFSFITHDGADVDTANDDRRAT
ncbi:MAG: DUF421 domain-containing protein [Actinomycetota bacterium]